MPHHSIFLEGVAYILGKSQLHMPVLDFPWLENGGFQQKSIQSRHRKNRKQYSICRNLCTDHFSGIEIPQNTKIYAISKQIPFEENSSL